MQVASRNSPWAARGRGKRNPEISKIPKIHQTLAVYGTHLACGLVGGGELAGRQLSGSIFSKTKQKSQNRYWSSIGKCMEML